MADDKLYDENPKAQANRKRYASDPSRKEINAANRDHREIFKRGIHNSSEEYSLEDAPLAPTQNPPILRLAERLELVKGRLVARNIGTNITRPLSEDEIRNQIEIVSCKDKYCSSELRGRDIGVDGIVIPAVPPSSLPSVNTNAAPTFTPTPSMRTEIKPLKRTSVSPDVPVMTH